MTDRLDRYRAFPADGFDARWTTWDGEHTETLTLRWENEGWTASGRVTREQIEYVIRLSPLWHVRQFLLFRDLPQPDLWLGTDGHGRWGEMNGVHRPELDGARDIALDVTPFTLSVPIRRLPIHAGDSFGVTTLRIDVETLSIRPTAAVYHRLTEHTWRITHDETTIDVTVDEYGLATDVDGTFRRS